MPEEELHFESVLDSLFQQLAILDGQGRILWVNRAWRQFGRENGGEPAAEWRNVNYLDVCRASADTGDADGAEAWTGIRRVLTSELSHFEFEYPCHSPSVSRWFLMRLRPVQWDGPRQFVVSHLDITKRKLAELGLEELAVRDGLTGIANRRRLDAFLADTWRRAARGQQPTSLLLLDIDHFKRFNDRYGHMAGDDCLRGIGRALTAFARRPDDLAARFGGEEFCLVLGDTSGPQAKAVADKLCGAIEALAIPHDGNSAGRFVTASIGVATAVPAGDGGTTPGSLLRAADAALYSAKKQGRNRVCVDASSAG